MGMFIVTEADAEAIRIAARQQRCPVGDSGGIFRIRGADR
jgi:hypothetical protein